MVSRVSETVEDLERRIDRLRGAVRQAVLAGDKERASALRRELKQAEQAWEDALTRAEESQEARSDLPSTVEGGHRQLLLPLREQVHEALSLLTVPAAPRLIATVHEAFFVNGFPSTRLTSLKRDEERSFRSAPYARPYYICAALTVDRLAPIRGLLAVSTWPMERRVIGSLSPRVDFLTAAIKVAEAIGRLPTPIPPARRLLWRFAASIPGAAESSALMEPETVTQAAKAELKVHQAADRDARRVGAQRAHDQLDDAGQLFGARLELRDQQRGRG